MKCFLSIYFIAAVLACNAQTTVSVKWSPHVPAASSDTIYYSPSQKLTWKDFKGKPNPASDALAITSSGFGYTSGASYRDGKLHVSVSVYCYFAKQKSWVIKGKESDYALTHEQHHFDVTWIVTNSFMQKLKTASFTWDNYHQLLDELYQQTLHDLEKMQNAYDGETRNGRLEDVQRRWNKKISQQLSGLATN